MAEPGTTNGENAGGDPAAGGGNDDWRSSLPEDLRDAPNFKDIEDVGSLAKQFVDLQSYQGNSLRIPGEDASAEDVSKFHQKVLAKVPTLMPTPDLENDEVLDSVYTRLGRPEDATGYQIPKVDTGDIEMDMTMADVLKPIAHKYGLNQKQFAGIVADMTATNAQAAVEMRNQQAQNTAALSKEWGAAYTERVNKAANVAQATGAPAVLVEAVKNGQAGAETMKWLYSLSQSLGGEVQNMVNAAGAPTMTPDEASMRISEIRNNKEHPYWITSDPGHKAARKKMRELHTLAYPGDAPGISGGAGGLM